MKNIKQLSRQLVIPLVAIGLAGCDWSAPDDGEYWSDSYNWVNFSGTYKNSSGGAVVQLPATSAGVTENVDEPIGSLNSGIGYSGNLGHPSIIPGTLQISSAEWTFSDDKNGNLVNINNAGSHHGDEPGMKTTIGGVKVYSGTLANRPVVPGSLTISSAGWTFHDDGLGNLTTSSGSFGASAGHISYNSGAWSLDLNTDDATLISAGNPINGSYQYSASGVGSVGHISYASGAWSLDLNTAAAVANQGKPITGRYRYSTQGGGGGDVINVYTMTVMQEGNLINITDSNGSQYTGQFGSIRATSGWTKSNGSTDLPINGDEIVAQFEANGLNGKTGRNVKIVGTCQSTVYQEATTWGAPVMSGSFILTKRQMNGTWMEDGGLVLDIVASSGNSAMIATSEIVIGDRIVPTPRTNVNDKVGM